VNAAIIRNTALMRALKCTHYIAPCFIAVLLITHPDSLFGFYVWLKHMMRAVK